jgi:enoyl-CoA hydratase
MGGPGATMQQLVSYQLADGVATLTMDQINEVQIGLTLPRFAIEVCRQRLTPAQLTVAALTARPYTPADALDAGFLDEIVPAEALDAGAAAHAKRLTTLHAGAFAATKARLREPMLDGLRTAIRDDIVDWTERFGRPA